MKHKSYSGQENAEKNRRDIGKDEVNSNGIEGQTTRYELFNSRL